MVLGTLCLNVFFLQTCQEFQLAAMWILCTVYLYIHIHNIYIYVCVLFFLRVRTYLKCCLEDSKWDCISIVSIGIHTDDLIAMVCEGSLAAAGGRCWGTTPSAMIRVRVFNQNLRTGNCRIVALSVFSFFICDFFSIIIMNHDCHSWICHRIRHVRLKPSKARSCLVLNLPSSLCNACFFRFQWDDDMAPGSYSERSLREKKDDTSVDHHLQNGSADMAIMDE